MSDRRRTHWSVLSAVAAALGVTPAMAQGPPSSPPVSRVPKPIVVSSDGERPNVLVDQIGTAHVVWNQSTAQGSAEPPAGRRRARPA